MTPDSPPLAEHLRPVERPFRTVPPKWKRIAVRLSSRIGLDKTAYVFNVHLKTVSLWRSHAAREARPHE